MASPIPGVGISTAYGIKGSHWTGCGFHTGVDFACAQGTKILAPIAGTIRHRSYGSAFGPYQFAISPSAGQPFADDEVFFAHCLRRLPDGTEVNIGDHISEVGSLGNSTGPHLHFEYHVGCKNCWKCGNMANPSVVLNHGSSSGGGGGSEYPTPTSNKVYVSKLKFGMEDSDSVWYLQDALNDHPLSGGATLPTTGGYFSMTDAEVIKCQSQHGFGADSPGTSFVGPNQAEHLFAGRGLNIVYDTGNPSQPPPGGTQPPTTGDKPAAPALMLPGATWDPITNFPGLRPYKGTAKKITLHTTETSGKPNWESQQKGIPHLTVILEADERWQHLDFNIAAYTLTGGDNSPNSDAGTNIQIEIVGRASESPSWSDDAYDTLEEILVWLSENLGIPYEFPFEFGGNDGYGQNGAYRQTWTSYSSTSGIMGHAHATYNDHWDPGNLDIERLMEQIVTEPPPEPTDPPPIENSEYITKVEFEDFQENLAEAFRTIADMVDPDLAP